LGTAVLGVLAGEWLRARRSRWLKLLGLIVAGGVCLGLGYLWSSRFPIIKNIWTSSFVLWAGGWSFLLLALFYAVIDVLKIRGWWFFFVVIGMNAITVCVADRILNFARISQLLFEGVAKACAIYLGSPAHDVDLAAGAI